MSFEQHLFISYAHIDDQTFSDEEAGWIGQFHEFLESFLSMRIGSEAKIWRCNKLQGNDLLTDEIIEQFPKTALLVSVLSPRYLKSEWCARELNAFCESAAKNGGVVIKNKARVFKVIKTPVKSQDPLPAIMKDMLGYEFFTYEDGAPLELDPRENTQDYRRKVSKLAWDLAQLLDELGTDNDATAGIEESVQTDDKPKVYLAECSYDQKQAREKVESELKRHGYSVLPEQPLPRVEPDYVAAVDDLLQKCGLSIHLVGTAYGAVPDGPTLKSETVLQNELAAKQSKSSGLSRVIWLPEGTRSEQSQQQSFIDLLHKDAEAQFGADLITGDLEDFKSSMHATLKKLQQPVVKPAPEVENNVNTEKAVYLICDEQDRKATVPLRKFFRAQGIEVSIPAFEGDASEIRQAHQQTMASCDAIILFYGAGDEAWKRTLDNELRKLPGYRSEKRLLAEYTYLAEPKTVDKEDMIDMEEPNVIDGLDGFNESSMSEFINELNDGKTA